MQEPQGFINFNLEDSHRLLKKIIPYCYESDSIKSLLRLRLVSGSFNKAILSFNDDNTWNTYPIGIHINRRTKEKEWGTMEERLCRQVTATLDYRCNFGVGSARDNCAFPTRLRILKSLLNSRGVCIQIMQLNGVHLHELACLMCLVSQKCVNLRKLTIDISETSLFGNEALETPGPSVPMTSLVISNRNDKPWTVTPHVCEYVGKVLSSYIEGVVNFKTVGSIIPYYFGNGGEKKKLEFSDYHSASIHHVASISSMITRAAGTLEELTISPLLRPICISPYTVKAKEEEVPTTPVLPNLKKVTLAIRHDIPLGVAMWRLILQNAASSLESIEIDCHDNPKADDHVDGYFWVRLASKVEQSLISVKSLEFRGKMYHPLIQLKQLFLVFPKLCHITLSLMNVRLPCHHFISKLLQGLCQWGQSLMELRIAFRHRCSINDVIDAMEEAGEGLFTNGLRVFKLARQFRDENVAFLGYQDLKRLEKILLCTQKMKVVEFHSFQIAGIDARQLTDYTARHNLPVKFMEDMDNECWIMDGVHSCVLYPKSNDDGDLGRLFGSYERPRLDCLCCILKIHRN